MLESLCLTLRLRAEREMHCKTPMISAVAGLSAA
jgi:hypothetical protein